MSPPDVAAQLWPGDRVVRVERTSRHSPARPLAALRSLGRLTPQGERTPLNRSGPVVAAGAMTRESGDPPEHLRLFEALFGRDALTCARILHPWYPGLTRRTVLALAALQGVRDDVASEEEPGRIPHEVREPGDPVAARITAGNGWAWPYYGSVDATCSWIVLAATLARSDVALPDAPVVRRDGRTVTLHRCVRDAVDWLLHRIRTSPSGLVESVPRFAGSIENQVWKDSRDAYVHADGTLARVGTVASVEVQALAHDALVAASDLLGPGARLLRTARTLRDRVLTDFWVDGGDCGFFALGLDRDPSGRERRIAVRSSNMGHLLDSGILDGPDAAVARRRDLLVAELGRPDLLCAAGVRTLASSARGFRPDGYHTGSSWPWDTYVVASGLRRHGARAMADDLCRRIMAGYRATGHFPEFFSGDDEPVPHVGDLVVDVTDEQGHPHRICQPPQEVQAWTAATVLAVKRWTAPATPAATTPGRRRGPR
ncbi:hypothetical protein H7X46_27850 [Pseudonocardia sp. C8]|uniref:amylo-alpha-1,6-glucosidase n=1 Tax=Pseudonocardia sp. C8 TaxID=2762759 RepID=UPI001642AA63|nr:hypothetical protein [Pseudonocardia sp. C8]MBC3194871.1 hypothetical protein [Pseudonocardia sp. C8]